MQSYVELVFSIYKISSLPLENFSFATVAKLQVLTLSIFSCNFAPVKAF